MFATDDRYYLEHVIDLSESEKVVFVEDVFTDRQLKLLERDSVFSPQLYELLRYHKLSKPLDELIFVVHRLAIGDVVQRAEALVGRLPYMQALLKALPQPGLPLAALLRVELNGVLANKLTVMCRRLPDLFDHSVQVALVAVAMGQELGVGGPMLNLLAMAGLFHDLGELHVDPQLRHAPTPLSEQEWCQVHGHPLVGHAILSQFPEMPAPVARAVLEHHERMDGSGYPHGTAGSGLSPMGRILAVAEVLTAICQRDPLRHVGTVFKSVANLDEQVVQAANRLLWRMQAQSSQALLGVEVDLDELRILGAAVSRIMQSWKRLLPKLEDNPLERARRLVLRMVQIRVALLDAGICPEACEESLLSFAGEAEPLREASCLLREICYQLQGIVSETQRRWNFSAGKKSSTTEAVEKWLRQSQAALAKLGRPGLSPENVPAA